MDVNSDGKISFEEFDIFVRMVYETEYLPALEREIKKRNISKHGSDLNLTTLSTGRKR